MALKITDLPVDALSCILASVAKLPDGATDIAKSISVCKRFLEAGKSNIVYDVVCFQKVQVHSRHHLFQRTDGLLYSCAGAGNLYAQFLLAQVILKSFTQLERCGIKSGKLSNFREYRMRYNTGNIKFQDGYLVASFMASFIPVRGFRPFLSHWELVKVFLSNCTRVDIRIMYGHIRVYVKYFTGPRTHHGTDAAVFLRSVHSMCFMVEHNSHTFPFRHLGHVIVNDTSNANNLVKEEVRVKALLDFDRVSRVFPGFVVLKPKK